MPAITDRSEKKPALKIDFLSHGTLCSIDLQKSRRFYEEVLGMEVIQTSRVSLVIRLGSDHTYVVVEDHRIGDDRVPMHKLYHNGLNVGTKEDVMKAYQALTELKDEYGILSIETPHTQHKVFSFYFEDLDGNWWEIMAGNPRGYSALFDNLDKHDITGRHNGIRRREKETV